ncbi:penicillin-binding protein 2 [Bacillus lacus]|uniref:serine-type D-Ala-D-Ala carboxypeptidase n=1 Tax=Metabacillus lacus TaxID=1983721 RepID=A0A7X2IWZ0_9BACI|nr:penicillin-binding protein 2 [Metabacillus lacus]MRX71356.1 penicillin-binding protein 2 [Metabacillus lacus]
MQSAKRLKVLAAVILIGLTCLTARMAQISIFQTESFTDDSINLVEESVRQRTQQVLIDDGRGSFTDKNGEPLTNSSQPVVVFFPFLNKISWNSEKLATILKVPPSKITEWIEGAVKPVLVGEKEGVELSQGQLKDINELNIPGVFGILKQSDIPKRLAQHTIGFTSQFPEKLQQQYSEKEHLSLKTKLGIIGLEEAFDEFLLPETETKLLYHVDGKGQPLFGVNVKYIADSNPFFPVTVKTTLSKDIQQIAEDILIEEKMKKGGLILLDIQNSEIAAVVSKPDLNPSAESTYYNHMFQSIFPGSVFKTVISAAAIQYGLDNPNKNYDCRKNLYGEYDDKLDGGLLGFEESFAQSCNYTFTSLAQEIMDRDPNSIEEFAGKLGLLEGSGWKGNVFHQAVFQQITSEDTGTVWEDEADKSSKKAIAQTAIGQKNVRISPLSIANMMATIARGGEKKQVKLVDSIQYKNGSALFSFPDQEMDGEEIDKYTAQKLQQLLKRVVDSPNGTGRRFQSLPLAVSGKSGTAETGKVNASGEKLYHKWFAGYFPASHPQYALVVVDMDTPAADAVTNQVFYKMVEKMADFSTLIDRNNH